jgi:hypothetical protein
MTEPKIVICDLKLLERIAEYYEFPLAVFFGNERCFPEKTRNEAWRKKAEKYDKIKDIVEDMI